MVRRFDASQAVGQKRRGTLSVVAFLAGILTACGQAEGDPRNGHVVKDSAGIEIVSANEPGQHLSLELVLSIGEVDGKVEYLFENVRSVTIGPAGGLWVADANPSVRQYNPAGEYVRSVGGRGQGPGESEMYYSAMPKGSEVMLLGVPGVLQVFSADGRLVASEPGFPGRDFVQPVGASGDAWILQTESYDSGERELFRSRIGFLRLTGLGSPPDTIGVFTGDIHQTRGPGRYGSASWFYGNPSFGVDGKGRLAVSDTLAYRIEWYGTTGNLERVIERDAQLRPFDPDWLEEMQAGFEAAQRAEGNLNRPVNRERLEVQMSTATPAYHPPHLPFIQGILTGSDSWLWVERGDLHPNPGLRAVAHQYGYVRHAWLPSWSAPQVYDLFDENGRYYGTVEMPGRFAPMAVSGRSVYGVYYDDLGVEMIHVYEAAPIQGTVNSSLD